MSSSGWKTFKLSLAIIATVTIVAGLFAMVIIPYYNSTRALVPVTMYTSGELAYLTISNASAGFTSVTTGVTVQLFNLGVNPFAFGAFGLTPYRTGSYSSTTGYWQFPGVTNGTYNLIIAGSGSKTQMQPIMTQVTVPASPGPTTPVTLSPASVNIYQNSTVSFLSVTVENMTSTGGIAKANMKTINGTGSAVSYFSVSYTLSLSGSANAPTALLGPVYLWFTNIADFTYSSVSVGGISYTPTLTTTGIGGYTGWYVDVPLTWTSGTSPTITLSISQSNTGTTSTTLKMTVASDFNALSGVYRNKAYTDTSYSISCYNV